MFVLSFPAFSSSLYLLIACVVFGAGIVRGATGFGFSMIMMVVLTLFMPPASIVPVLLLWELLASSLHLPFVWRDVDWKPMRWLGIGAVAGTPVGVYLLTTIPVQPMCFAINALVLFFALLLFMGKRPKNDPGTGSAIGIGLASGIINAAAATPGPPIILFYAVNHDSASSRASFIAFFLFIDIFAFAMMLHENLITGQSLLFCSIFALPMLAGILAGHKWAAHIPEVRLKKIVQILLMIISAVGMIRAWAAF